MGRNLVCYIFNEIKNISSGFSCGIGENWQKNLFSSAGNWDSLFSLPWFTRSLKIPFKLLLVGWAYKETLIERFTFFASLFWRINRLWYFIRRKMQIKFNQTQVLISESKKGRLWINHRQWFDNKIAFSSGDDRKSFCLHLHW